MSALKGLSPLVCIVLGLTLGCGDDDKGDGDDVVDAGGGGAGLASSCSNAAGAPYAGKTARDLFSNVKGTGACTSEADVVEACVKNPSVLAADVGRACISVPADKFKLCVAEGDNAAIEGVRDLTTLSVGCTDCYAVAVECGKNQCFAECVMPTTPAEQQACVDCRATKGCTSGFYTCSGLPTPEELMQ